MSIVIVLRAPATTRTRPRGRASRARPGRPAAGGVGRRRRPRRGSAVRGLGEAHAVVGIGSGGVDRPRSAAAGTGCGSRWPWRSSTAAGPAGSGCPRRRRSGTRRSAPWRNCRSRPAAPCSGRRAPREPQDRAGGADHQQRGRLADRPRQAEDRARSGCPAGPTGRTWSRTTCQRVAPSASAAWRSEVGTVRSASWVAITITGRISRLSVRPPAQSDGPSARPFDAEGPDEQRPGRGCRRRSTAPPRGWRCSSG